MNSADPIDLKPFLISLAEQAPDGVRLCELVLAALEAGFPSTQRFALTTRIAKSVQQLTRQGVLKFTGQGWLRSAHHA